MKKEKIIYFVKEFLGYLVVITILLLIGSKLGWIEPPIWDTALAITLGWAIWAIGKLIWVLISKKRRASNGQN